MAELATVTQIKDYLGISGSSEDTFLGDLLERAESFLRDLCNRGDGWGVDEWTETLDGNGAQYLTLTYTPINTAVTLTVTCDGETVWTGIPAGNVNCPFQINATTGVIRYRTPTAQSFAVSPGYGTVPPADRGVYPNFTEGSGNWTFEYTGGYTLSPTSNVPKVLTQVAIEVVKALYLNRTRDEALKSESLGEYSYTLNEGAASSALDAAKARWGIMLGDHIPRALI